MGRLVDGCGRPWGDPADVGAARYARPVVATIQLVLFLALALVAFGIEVWALIDAARRSPQAFTYAGKRTRTFWLALTGAAAAIGFLAIPPPIGLSLVPFTLSVLAVVPAAVYLADVRPAVRGYGRRRPPRGGGW